MSKALHKFIGNAKGALLAPVLVMNAADNGFSAALRNRMFFTNIQGHRPVAEYVKVGRLITATFDSMSIWKDAVALSALLTFVQAAKAGQLTEVLKVPLRVRTVPEIIGWDES
eukprot:scaffold658244_cov46-Prasinocladus_malaysianus.AAC.2